MWFGEPHPFPERGSPTKLRMSGQQSYKGWPCRVGTRVLQQKHLVRWCLIFIVPRYGTCFMSHFCHQEFWCDLEIFLEKLVHPWPSLVAGRWCFGGTCSLHLYRWWWLHVPLKHWLIAKQLHGGASQKRVICTFYFWYLWTRVIGSASCQICMAHDKTFTWFFHLSNPVIYKRL